MGAFVKEYSGILNFNYKVRPNGTLAISETKALPLAHWLLQLAVDVSGHRSVKGRKCINASAPSLRSQ